MQPVHSAPCQTGRASRDLEKVGIEKMPSKKIIDHVETKCAAPIAFAPNREEILLFRVLYPKRNVITKREQYLLLHINAYIDFLEKLATF